MLTITIYGGANTIGGNQILLEDVADSPGRGGSALFFDFGTTFAQRDKYFEEYLRPRPGAGLLDPLEMGLLPPLKGIYRRDLDPDGSVISRYESSPHFREVMVDGVLLSHAHVDHSGYISFLREDIPIYSSAMSAFIAKAMQDSGVSDFEKEVCYINPREAAETLDRPYLAPKGNYLQRPFVFSDGRPLSEAALRFWIQSPNLLGLSEDELKRTRRKGLVPAGPVPAPGRVGGLNVRFFPVDHSVHGAGAWAVETSAGWVVYTGDLRWHGTRGADTRLFVHEVASLRPRLLLCEGTRATGDIHRQTIAYTEQDVRQRALDQVARESRLVIADFGPRNIDRLISFLAIARETGRQLVILPKDAYLLDAMSLVEPSIPNVASSRELFIYKDLKSRPDPWERDFREGRYADRFLDSRQIAHDPGEFILCFSFWDVKNLIDIRPQGGSYIFSSSEAYTEEQAIDLRRLKEWLDHFDIRAVGLPVDRDGKRVNLEALPPEEQGLHASGHASGPDLIQFVKEVNPKTLVPIHTLEPRYFVDALGDTNIQVIVPQPGQRIELT